MRALAALVVAGAVIIAAIGFAGSYAAVRALALHKGFGWFANVFPVGVDAGIVVLLALDLLLTWLRIPFPLLRQAAWLLTAATVAFNGAAAWPDPLGVGMHAIIPVLFVVTVEAARHAIGRVADIAADKHMESVRVTRWLLAPLPTFRLWRRMKLWELRSYEEVIGRERDRLVYRALLRARYGVAWRRRAPTEAIMPLRMARFGVPLAETAEAGLAAAGITVPPALIGTPIAARPGASGESSEDHRGVPATEAPADGAGPADAFTSVVSAAVSATETHAMEREAPRPASAAGVPADVDLEPAPQGPGVPPWNSYEESTHTRTGEPREASGVEASDAHGSATRPDALQQATAGTAALGGSSAIARVTARVPDPGPEPVEEAADRADPLPDAGSEAESEIPAEGGAPDDEDAVGEGTVEPDGEPGRTGGASRMTSPSERLRELFLALPLPERAKEDRELAAQWCTEVGLTFESTRKYLGRRVRRPLLRELFEGLADEERALSDREVAQMLYAHVGLKWSAAEKWVRDLREELLKEHVPLVLSDSPELSDREVAERTHLATGLDVEEAAALIAVLPRSRRRRVVRT
jgi:uncharacterized protein DUF2637